MTFQSFSGKDYLKIDIANSFGLDKENWDVRIAWFDTNEPNLENLIKQAEEPALFYAGMQAYRDAQQGKAITYPISLDATSSGIQILSALTGCRKGAELCNIVDVGHRSDCYTKLYNEMVAETGGTAKIDRKDTKRAIMTAFYASTAVPKEVFGEGKLLDTFFEIMNKFAPGAWELNEMMIQLWNPNALSNDWVLPDNFHVHVKIMSNVEETVHFLDKPYQVNYTVNMPLEKGRSLGANMTHSVDGMIVRELVLRTGYDAERMHYVRDIIEGRACAQLLEGDDELVKTLWQHYLDCGFLSARILSYLTAGNMHLVDGNVILDLLDSLPKKPFKVISVHDCFRCLPNYGNDLRRQYNRIMAEIARSDLLSFLLSQIIGRVVKVGKHDDKLWYDILDANYALS